MLIASGKFTDWTGQTYSSNPQRGTAHASPQIETDVVQHALASLNPHKGQGPDSLHPAVLKAIAPLVAQPLTDLFNLSLVSAEVPDDWRSAIVCPIFKKGDREDPGNYRPVSLTSTVCKLMETALKGPF